MVTRIASALMLGLCAVPAWSQDPASEVTDDEAAAETTVEAAAGPTESGEDAGPKTMSGMSILGNEEAPKSLVIIPWKSSELGEDISLTNTLDDRAQPVDKDVFLRELRFYKIRSGK